MKLLHIKFTHSVAYNSVEKPFFSVAEQPQVKVEILKDCIKLTDRTHTIIVPMSLVAYIVYDKE